MGVRYKHSYADNTKRGETLPVEHSRNQNIQHFSQHPSEVPMIKFLSLVTTIGVLLMPSSSHAFVQSSTSLNTDTIITYKSDTVFVKDTIKLSAQDTIVKLDTVFVRDTIALTKDTTQNYDTTFLAYDPTKIPTAKRYVSIAPNIVYASDADTGIIVTDFEVQFQQNSDDIFIVKGIAFNNTGKDLTKKTIVFSFYSTSDTTYLGTASLALYKPGITNSYIIPTGMMAYFAPFYNTATDNSMFDCNSNYLTHPGGKMLLLQMIDLVAANELKTGKYFAEISFQ